MGLLQILIRSIKGVFPGFLTWTVFPKIPCITAEQRWPVGAAPSWRNYGANILISLSTAFLSLPLGIAAGLRSSQLRPLLPWKPISFGFHSIGAQSVVWPEVEILVMTFAPLFIHDCWFYWSHRIEHRVPILWEFHKIHHSDELMNTSTWAGDHSCRRSLS